MGKGSIGWCEGVGREGRVEKQQNPCAARVSSEAQTSRRPFITECLLCVSWGAVRQKQEGKAGDSCDFPALRGSGVALPVTRLPAHLFSPFPCRSTCATKLGI